MRTAPLLAVVQGHLGKHPEAGQSERTQSWKFTQLFDERGDESEKYCLHLCREPCTDVFYSPYQYPFLCAHWSQPVLGAPLFPTGADLCIIGERGLGFLTLPGTCNFCLFRPESYANIKFLPFIFWWRYNEVGKAHHWFLLVVVVLFLIFIGV